MNSSNVDKSDSSAWFLQKFLESIQKPIHAFVRNSDFSDQKRMKKIMPMG